MNLLFILCFMLYLLVQINGHEEAWENSPFFRHYSTKNGSGLPHYWKYSVCASDDGSIIAAAMPGQGDFGGQILDLKKIYISKDYGESWQLTFSTTSIHRFYERHYDWNPMVCSATGQFMAIVKYNLEHGEVWASNDFGATFHPTISEFSYLGDSTKHELSQKQNNNIRHSMYVMNKQGDLILTRWGVKNKVIENFATRENYIKLIKIPQNLISIIIIENKPINFRVSVPLCTSLAASDIYDAMCELKLPPFTTSPFKRLDDVRISMDRGGRIYIYQNSPTFVNILYYPRFYSKPITRYYNDYPEYPHEVFQSSDSGDSWELIKNIPRVNTIIFDKSGQYGIALHTMYRLNNPSAELYYSHDSGQTWLLSGSAQQILSVGLVIKDFHYNGTITSIIQHHNTGKSIIFTLNDGSVFVSNDYGVSYCITTGAVVFKSDTIAVSDDDGDSHNRWLKQQGGNYLRYRSWPQLVSDINGNHIVLIDLFQEKESDCAAVLLAKRPNEHPLLSPPVSQTSNDNWEIAKDGFIWGKKKQQNLYLFLLVLMVLFLSFSHMLYCCCINRTIKRTE